MKPSKKALNKYAMGILLLVPTVVISIVLAAVFNAYDMAIAVFSLGFAATDFLFLSGIVEDLYEAQIKDGN